MAGPSGNLVAFGATLPAELARRVMKPMASVARTHGARSCATRSRGVARTGPLLLERRLALDGRPLPAPEPRRARIGFSEGAVRLAINNERAAINQKYGRRYNRERESSRAANVTDVTCGERFRRCASLDQDTPRPRRLALARGGSWSCASRLASSGRVAPRAEAGAERTDRRHSTAEPSGQNQ